MNMVTPLFFLPCEKAIVDAFANELSLISIFETVVPIPFEHSGEEPPHLKEAKFIIPPLALLTTWKFEPGGEGRYEQMVIMVAPDGKETPVVPPVPFELKSSHHRVFQQAAPVAGRIFGEFKLILKVRREGERNWETASVYPLQVEDFPPLPSENQEKVSGPESTS